ncbi:uncharacterized protein FOMMEDRAFT_162266 [Fomitiporia mediterranea MF3/22]|uniref:uncharacterized protein n=1 Tax=Fomitiporia mediterranea (strain MF3/22) TaxID=694068 RepID=UPI000440929D|nr:uncharacterized protein FOMMEDRAFT_162266 [Fomitiporia mediterranea MF3/22]EJC97922.1 hypothetical protein FOMMEDRAFT_162266 [Fomitiporia mediterranea MF3/22]
MLPSSPPKASKNPRHIAQKGDKRPIAELLPLEIIEYVFEIGARAEEADKGWDGVRNAKYGMNGLLSFPARVSHVCRRWRNITIDMPTLWTKLDFTEPRPFVKSKCWLDGSKKAPLDLYIDLSPVEVEIDVDDIDNQDDENEED